VTSLKYINGYPSSPHPGTETQRVIDKNAAAEYYTLGIRHAIYESEYGATTSAGHIVFRVIDVEDKGITFMDDVYFALGCGNFWDLLA
jgi:hypothetical protein